MNQTSKILQIADALDSTAKQYPSETLSKLENRARDVGKSWCGSWLGYHSRIYYSKLKPIPAGARFSKEWGLMSSFAVQGSQGDWVEYVFETLVSEIKRSSRVSDLSQFETQSVKVGELFENEQANLLSILTPIGVEHPKDTFLKDLIAKIKKETIHTYRDFVEAISPRGQQMSRDMVAIQAGIQTPPHFSVLCEVAAIRGTYDACATLGKYARRAASHIDNMTQKSSAENRVGANIFIGHGRSSAWKDLRDFIQDRIHLPWDEFNRVPVAGVTNISRLSQMLDHAAFAFIIMTAEDEQKDGQLRARMNVIHEAGLFQGRLGFERAILLLEEGCEEFSNVQGLGQIRFPTGNISAAFEEIRRVLERERLLVSIAA